MIHYEPFHNNLKRQRSDSFLQVHQVYLISCRRNILLSDNPLQTPLTQIVRFYKMVCWIIFTCLHTLAPGISAQTQLYWAVWPRSSRKFPQQAARTSSLSVGGEDKAIGWRSSLWLATGWARSSRCNVQYAVPGQVLQPGKQERLFRLSSQGQPTWCPLWYSGGHSDVLWQSFGWVMHYAGQQGCKTRKLFIHYLHDLCSSKIADSMRKCFGPISITISRNKYIWTSVH